MRLMVTFSHGIALLQSYDDNFTAKEQSAESRYKFTFVA